MRQFFAIAACFAERIKVNSISREVRDGRPLWIKRRRRSARLTLSCANRFFRLAGNPVQAITDLHAWQCWEVESFRQLHGEEFAVFPEGERTVAAGEVPGVSLAHSLAHAELTPAMVAAAARELRRAHATRCAVFPDGWSHGDPHAGNFLYEAAQDRARLIDFEVMHEPALPALDRHADDLLVFLQDVVGRVSADAWLPLALAFLDAYDRPETVARLAPRLILPRGIARLWWAVRTTYLPAVELVDRLERLRDALKQPGLAARR
ncbi:MAG: hypothetical protein WCF18_18020 [Chthoniobacteraceae bacterium]